MDAAISQKFCNASFARFRSINIQNVFHLTHFFRSLYPSHTLPFKPPYRDLCFRSFENHTLVSIRRRDHTLHVHSITPKAKQSFLLTSKTCPNEPSPRIRFTVTSFAECRFPFALRPPAPVQTTSNRVAQILPFGVVSTRSPVPLRNPRMIR